MNRDDLLKKQHAAADAADDKTRARAVAVLDGFGDRLSAGLLTLGLDPAKPLTPGSVSVVASAIAPMLRRLRSDLAAVLAPADQEARSLALVHFAALLGLSPLPFLTVAGDAAWSLELDSFVAQLGALLSALVQRGASQGWPLIVILRNMAGPDGSGVAANRARLGQLAHLQRVAAYSDAVRKAAKATNDAEQAAAGRASPQPGAADPGATVPPKPTAPKVKIQIVEVLDSRNHPFSRVANGMVADVDEDFRVPVADVAAMARAMGKRPGAVFWRTFRGSYVGRTLPAHFGDRGRLAPIRA